MQNFIDLSVEFHDEGVWSEKDYPLAIMLWAAHMVTLYKVYQASRNWPLQGRVVNRHQSVYEQHRLRRAACQLWAADFHEQQ